jgi:hypothetical protein
MTTILLGSNKFTNCRTLLGVRDRPVLRVMTAPLRVSLKTPPGVRPELSVEIEENQQREGPRDLRIVYGENNAAVFLGDYSLILATTIDPSTAHLKIDLRPLGLKIYDDVEGLHVGGNVLARNAFTDCTTAIALD